MGLDRDGQRQTPTTPCDFRAGIHELIAPDSFALEIAYAHTKAERRGMIQDAAARWTDVMTSAPHFFPSHPLAPRAIHIASPGSHWRLRPPIAYRRGHDLDTGAVE
jgi:hypothetical protein